MGGAGGFRGGGERPPTLRLFLHVPLIDREGGLDVVAADTLIAAVKATYADASILENGRVVFNIGGNKFRLVVRINYAYRIVYIRFVGTHKEYDDVDAETV